MNAGPPSLSMMTTSDMSEVVTVERAAYSTGWPATAFEREITQNAMARYIVLRTEPDAQIVGYAGLWLMVDEAHVVTVAVLPASRRHSYGRILVHGLIAVAISEGMEMATLEVRASNSAARTLYGKYGFYEVGERRRYYSDNQEDAIIMSTEPLLGAPYAARMARLGDELVDRYPGILLSPSRAAH